MLSLSKHLARGSDSIVQRKKLLLHARCFDSAQHDVLDKQKQDSWLTTYRSEMASCMLSINEKLRATLNELEGFFQIKLDHEEVERIFVDTENDQVSSKHYILYRQKELFFPDWEISGAVDDYEPETLILQCSGGVGKNKKFEEFFAFYEQ